MLRGKTEGYEFFNLGMAPLSGMEVRPFAPFWQRAASVLYAHGEHFYNFEGLRQFKDKFHPVWEPRYLAAQRGSTLPLILKDVAALIGGGLRGVLTK